MQVKWHILGDTPRRNRKIQRIKSKKLDLSEGIRSGGVEVLCDLGSHGGNLISEEFLFILEVLDVSGATVDRILEEDVGFVAERDDGIAAAVGGKISQDLGHVARAKGSVHGDESRRVLLREVRHEHASRDALSPQELACGAWRS